MCRPGARTPICVQPIVFSLRDLSPLVLTAEGGRKEGRERRRGEQGREEKRREEERTAFGGRSTHLAAIVPPVVLNESPAHSRGQQTLFIYLFISTSPVSCSHQGNQYGSCSHSTAC